MNIITDFTLITLINSWRYKTMLPFAKSYPPNIGTICCSSGPLLRFLIVPPHNILRLTKCLISGILQKLCIFLDLAIIETFCHYFLKFQLQHIRNSSIICKYIIFLAWILIKNQGSFDILQKWICHKPAISSNFFQLFSHYKFLEEISCQKLQRKALPIEC